MKKQFKTESKRLMDLMINSIYTNKEIFLREIVSNASDAIDKLHYKSLTDKNIKINKEDLCINVSIDKDLRKLIISDNGIGMNKEELESNLGTIAKIGSFDFKMPGGVTINYQRFHDMAVEEMDKIDEWIRTQHAADYFFNSNTI